MTTPDVLTDAFDRIGEVVRASLHDLDEQQLTFRPSDTGNSIAWLIWHLTRVQDDHVADAAGSEQVWTSAGWQQRLDLPVDAADTGYGHSSADVSAVRASAADLQGYHDAVLERTREYVATLTEEDLARIVDEGWDPPVTLAARLVSVVGDDLQHAGQAAYVRGLLP